MKDLEEKRDFDFMTERVKNRPLNKRKLLRKTLFTAAMALVFGLIACVTFLASMRILPAASGQLTMPVQLS